MSSAVVRVQSPEEREYSRYLVQVEARKSRAADVRAEIETLKVTLGRFQTEYHARLARLFAELDRLDLSIAEYRRRITLLSDDPEIDPDEVEGEIETDFSEQREQLEHDEEQTTRYERTYKQERARPQIDEATEEEIRRLYRELARHHHPDLARTEQERQRGEAVMRQINAALRDRDLGRLREIAREAASDDPAFDIKSVGEKLVWAIREVARLDELIAGLEAELSAIRNTDTHALWQRQESGEDVIGQLETRLQLESLDRRRQLDILIAEYRDQVNGVR